MTVILEKPAPIKAEPIPTQRIVILGGWEQFELVRQGFEQSKRVRLAYYDGEIEIIMPGQFHELFKTIIGMLIEAYLTDRRLEFLPTGSMTQKVEKLASAEADESYVIGDFKLSIEVKATSGNLSKLRIYKALGIHEVWFWEDGVLEIYQLTDEEYILMPISQIPELQGLDLTALAKCVLLGETSRIQAIEAFRAAHPIAPSS